MNALGEMVAYEAEGQGRLFQDIVPTKSMANLQTSLGSAELEIHTEQAFSVLRPDYLSLACLRGDHAALTYVMPVGAILPQLSEKEQALLKEPLWTCDVDISFKLADGMIHPRHWETRGPMPILYGVHDAQLVFDQDLMKGVTEESEDLVKKLVGIYYEKRHAHVFMPGDIMIVDNNRAVHGRSRFSPRYDGRDRFLVRCFGVKNIMRVRGAMSDNQRKILARYS
jgi:L-asparagine oxygenase